jgi:alpha-D-xyloside xylohydrolase
MLILLACLTLLLLSFIPTSSASILLANPKTTVLQKADGVVIPINGKFLMLQVCAPNIIRVEYAPNQSFFGHMSLSVISHKWPVTQWRFDYNRQTSYLKTSQLVTQVNMASGRVRFFDADMHPILAEKPNGRTLTPAFIQGESTYSVQQEWIPNSGESLYGLGQHQLGLMDIKGYDLELWQHNTSVAIPMLVSSNGYGIFWDNPSYTKFGDISDWQAIPADQLSDTTGKPGGLKVTYFLGGHFDRILSQGSDSTLDIEPPVRQRAPTGNFTTAGGAANPPASRRQFDPNAIVPGTHLPYGDASVRWEGWITPTQTGDYRLESFYNGGCEVWLNGNLIMNHWRQGWLPWIDESLIHMVAGHRYSIRIDWIKDQGANVFWLKWKTPVADPSTSLWSQVSGGEDYYFIYGPQLDSVISGYRELTGKTTLMPKWAFGLWQSRERYQTQQQSLDVVNGFRSRHIPFDNIVQDWFYWPANAWGSHQFDPARFPDPQGWINAIHAQHAHLMISVWPKFYTGTANFDAMNSRGFLFQPNLTQGLKDWVGYPSTFYDAFNPDARKLYWEQMKTAFFDKGVDAWWMDATEPDMLPTPTLAGTLSNMNPTALGPASKVLSGFPLENSKAVYEGQRKAAPNQRVFILTRSAFAGQQRYASSTWSGDISSTWTAMRKQIAAGLGFNISGMTYWTMDCGGFSVPNKFSSQKPTSADIDEWRELNTRWFEFATFVPLLRVHGQTPYREMWEFGGDNSPSYKAELKFDQLRYRLQPYIYSLAGKVTHDNYTFMRPLVMDFQSDINARNNSDQYMFGNAFLVNPITTYHSRSRSVYLPNWSGWYDFWTGKKYAGGQTIDSNAPYDAIPIYVKAGSIIPFGPKIEYTGEKPADPITLYVYTGADGSFDFYDDDGVTYGYERGQYLTIPIKYIDASHTLTIGTQQGSYPGALKDRTFNIVVIDKNKTVGYQPDLSGSISVRYAGKTIKVKLK